MALRLLIIFIFLSSVFTSLSYAQRDLENLKSEEEFKQFILATAPSEDAFVAVQRLARQSIDKKDWDGAIKVFVKYRWMFPQLSDRFDKIIELLKAPSQNLEVTNIEVINTEAGEYFPVITIDGKRLYFTGSDRKDGVGGEDIFYTDFIDGQWQKPKLLGPPFSTKEDDAINSISADGNTLVLFGNYKGAIGGGDNFYVEKTATGWSAIKPFPKPVNSIYWDCDGFLTADGKAFLFTSDRKGGIGEFHRGGIFFHGEYEGNTDIYVSLKNDSGWSKPINLGSTINTPFSERSPFLHPDGKTLYFSSDGHYGLGSLDVFKSVKLSDTSWTEWSEPVNLGKDINTSGFDVAYKISTDGDYAFFSSDRPGGKGAYDIYSIKLPEDAKPQKNVVTINGKVTDEKGNPLDASLKWFNLELNSLAGNLTSNPETGDYLIVLPVGIKYSYFAEKTGYYSVSKDIDLDSQSAHKELVENITLVSLKSLQESEEAIKLNNIYFDFNKYELRPESFFELERVYKFLSDNPSINIEISAHTDSKGSDEYNMSLSQKRAESVVSYLVSKGVSPGRLIAKGYGKSQPVASNDTEEGRAMNRRVEMKIL
jgi:outer membrane protein OmpA-like peptidoglycan-associated protein